MDLLNAILLGFMQGFTGLPISSSAHIRIVGEFIGTAPTQEQRSRRSPNWVVAFGVGLAVIVFFMRSSRIRLTSPHWRARIQAIDLLNAALPGCTNRVASHSDFHPMKHEKESPLVLATQ